MATMKKLYPRATLKRTIRAHTGKNVGKNVDVLVFLSYTMFLEELVREASINAKQNGLKRFTARDIRKVTEKCLRKFKG